MTETLPITEVKGHLSALVERVAAEHDRVVVTRNGRAAVVLISAEDLDSLEETMAVAMDAGLLGEIREGLAAADRGEVLSLVEVRDQLRREE